MDWMALAPVTTPLKILLFSQADPGPFQMIAAFSKEGVWTRLTNFGLSLRGIHYPVASLIGDITLLIRPISFTRIAIWFCFPHAMLMVLT